MTDLQAAVMGFVQGATEFLPISSTAHLRIVPSLFGWGDPGAAFTAVIQWGTLLAALLYFRKDIAAILLGSPETAEGEAAPAGKRLLLPILLGTLPIIVFGLLFKHKIENELRSLQVIGWSMIGFGLLLGVAEMVHRSRKSLDNITVGDGLAVGVAQAFALIPGASRSGTTITGALFMGIERSAAARFSFLLSLPAIFLAGAKELLDVVKNRDTMITTPAAEAAMHARPLIVATVVAFVVGWVSIDWLLKFLKRHPTYVFIVYRVAVGAAILALANSGRIH